MYPSIWFFHSIIMKYIFKNDFIIICTQIISEDKTPEEWAIVESSEMFQEGDYVGGFDATEMEFTFSIYENGKEYWFQLLLIVINDIAKGKKKEVEAG